MAGRIETITVVADSGQPKLTSVVDRLKGLLAACRLVFAFCLQQAKTGWLPRRWAVISGEKDEQVAKETDRWTNKAEKSEPEAREAHH